VQYISLAEVLGFDPAAMWSLAWTLFFARIVLGFAVGIDDVIHGFRSLEPDVAKRASDARALRRANVAVTVLHAAMLIVFALAALHVPA
jgi:hypothetical protein